MDTEELKSGVSLLEEIMKSEILNIPPRRIKDSEIINIAKKRLNNNNQLGGGHSEIPSEIFVVYKTDSSQLSNSQYSDGHNNLAFSSGKSSKCINSDNEKIIKYCVKHKK